MKCLRARISRQQLTLQYSDYAAVSVGSVSRVQSECFYLFGSSYHFSVTFISVLFSCAVLNFTVNVLTPPTIMPLKAL